MDKKRIIKRINRAKREVERLKELKSQGKLSSYGHWNLGYWQGRLSALEDWLDDMNE